MIRRRLSAAAVRLALVASFAVLVAACSGAVGPAPTPPAPPAAITVTPSSATGFSDLPTTFLVSGGNGNYVVTSNNQAVVPSQSTSATSFTVVPGAVTGDTAVTLTVGDTAGDTPASVTFTVKPRTVSNVVTVTPSASQSTACGNSICAGGDATVSVKLTQAGLPLAGRTVRFDVVSGDFSIINSAPGLPETVAASATAVSDGNGVASIRIRVRSDAGSETGLLRVTDVSSGFTQNAAVPIAPSSNAPLNAQPSSITFQGVTAGTCASGIAADVIVFGGRPPYLISQPGSFTVSPTVVTNNGGRFTVTAIGQCTAGSQIAVVDANGATVSVNAINKLSDLPVPTPTTPVADFVVAPATVTLASCNDVGIVTLSGGSGAYFGTSSNGNVLVSTSGNIGAIELLSHALFPPLQPVPASPQRAIFSDGKTTRTVTVNITAAGSC